VLAADETEGKTAALAGKLKELIVDAGGKVVHVQHGKALKNARGDGIENFGYVDGRSQPLLLQEDIVAESAADGTSRWLPDAPLEQALIQDPGVPVPPGTEPTSFGSLFVFRKLEQDVRGFKTREQVFADALALTGAKRELAGALVVGRFEDGTPVTLSDTPRDRDPQNDFNYANDPGTRCPFHAHIRKSNPRGSGGAEAESDERRHLMVRRGIPYEDKKRIVHPSELPDVESTSDFNTEVKDLLPTGGVGLLFMAYNADIDKQFKFTQQIWVNNPNFPIPGTHGIDPVIGQGPSTPGQQQTRTRWDDPASPLNGSMSFAGFVKMKGGEYFFSPSIAFLKSL
jgi:Dyp-type peroxidase family